MAYVGFAKPYIAKLVSEATKMYSDGFICGKGMEVSVTPNYNNAKLYADNMVGEEVNEFKDGAVTLGTDRLPSQAKDVMFGHTVTADGVTYKADDASNFVGVGFYVDKIEDGVRSYEATILYKAKFAEGAESFKTKGDNIEFQTPQLSGSLAPLSSTKEWKETKVFDTEAEAIAWIEEVLHIAGSLGTLTVTSVAGSTSGKTSISVSPAKATGNSYKYKVATSAQSVAYDQVLTTGWTADDLTSDITATDGQIITVVEVDSSNKAKKAGSTTIVSAS